MLSHRRTPSNPLRVRRVSISVSGKAALVQEDHQEDTILSPSSAKLPPVLPSSPNERRFDSVASAHPHDSDREGTSSSSDSQSTRVSSSSEKYGFLVYAASLVAWYLFLFWSFTPDEWLRKLGLDWYPSREWAILIPSWIMTTIVFVYLSYFALNLYHTPPLDSLQALTDTQAHLLDWSKELERNEQATQKGATVRSNITIGGLSSDDEDYIPPLMDLPAGAINRCIFGE